MKRKQTKQAFGLSLFLTVLSNLILSVILFNTFGDAVTVNNSQAQRTVALLRVFMSLVLAIISVGAAYILGSYAIDSGSILAYIGTFVLFILPVKFLIIAVKSWREL